MALRTGSPKLSAEVPGQLSESARNCCNAMNPQKQLFCQMPTRFSTNRRIHNAPHTADLYWTVRIVLPVTLPEVPVIVTLPAAMPVARPLVLIVAIELLLEVQAVELVMTLVVPSE